MGKSNTQDVIVLMEKLAESKSAFEKRYESKSSEEQKIEAHPRYKKMLEDFDSRLDVLASYQYGIERREKVIAKIRETTIPEETSETLSDAVQEVMRKCRADTDEMNRETQRSNQALVATKSQNNSKKAKKRVVSGLSQEIQQFVASSTELVADIEEELSLAEVALDTWNGLHQIQEKLNKIRSSVNQRLMEGINEAGNQPSDNDNIFQSRISELLQGLGFNNEVPPEQSLVEAAQKQVCKINDSPLLAMLASLANTSVKSLPSLHDHLKAVEALHWLQREAKKNADVARTVQKINDSQTPSLLEVSYDDTDIEAVKSIYKEYGRLVNAFLKDFLTQCHLSNETQSIDQQLVNKKSEALVKEFLNGLKEKINQFPSHKLISKALRHVIRKLSARISELSEQPVNGGDVKKLKQKSIAELQTIAESLFHEEATKKEGKSTKIGSLKQEVASLQLRAELKNKLTFLFENKSLLPDQFEERIQASIDALKEQAVKISLDSKWSELRSVETALTDVQTVLSKIDEDYERVRQRLKVNDLIAQNEASWQRLLDGADSKVNSCLEVNGVEFAKSKLTPLTESADMKEIETAAEQQEGLAVELQERLDKQSASQKALEERRDEELTEFKNKGAGIFKDGDADVWDKYCQWLQKNKGSVGIAERLCYVKQVLNDLEVENSEGGYGGVASTALVAAMSRAADQECVTVSPHTRKVDLSEQIRKLYLQEIMKSLPDVVVVDSSSAEESKEAILKREEVGFLRNIVNDVLALKIVSDANDVLPQLEQNEQERQTTLLDKIDSVTEQVKHHYNSNAAGKQEIQSIVNKYKGFSEKISGSEATDAKSLLDKIITLRANYRQAVPVIEKIGEVADKRLSVNWVKGKILTLVDFCRYCVRKLTDRTDAKSFKECARLTIYGSVKQQSAQARDTVSNTADIKISSPAA